MDVECCNLEAEIPGSVRPEEIVVVGAHYDTVFGTPGANDNTSGVAAVLALARRSSEHRPKRTLRFVAFVNEEPPFFHTVDMGSLVYARRCRERGERIVAMLSLETIGCILSSALVVGARILDQTQVILLALFPAGNALRPGIGPDFSESHGDNDARHAAVGLERED